MLKFNINTMTIDELKQLIASGDDSHNNQIRCSKQGEVYLSQDIVGAQNIEDVAFRFETTDAGNDYVGDAAANDEDYISRVYNAIKGNWNDGKPLRTYIDIF